MIYDRDYMQPEHDPRDAAVARPLILAIVLGFILQAIVMTFIPGGTNAVIREVMLTLDGIRSLKLWTLLTHPFVEGGISPWSVLSVVINSVMIHLFARALVPIIGRRGFWTVVGSAVVIGAAATLLVAGLRGLPGLVVGATGIAMALFAVFACIHADNVMLPFPLPIPIKAKHLAWFSIGLSTFLFIFLELQGQLFSSPPSSILGSMAAGWLYHRLIHRPGAIFQSSGPSIEMPAWMRRKKKVVAAGATRNFTVNVTPSAPVDIRAEVDRILDKINSKGFGALTAEERRILDEARDTLNKR